MKHPRASIIERRAQGLDMASTLLELIEAERVRVQELRTQFVIAAALQTELDARVGDQELNYNNTTLKSMMVEHRLGLVQRLAGWVRAVCGAGGFLDRIIANHLKDFRADDDDDDVPAIGMEKTRTIFERRLPGTSTTGEVAPKDIEAIREDILERAAPVLASCDAFRRWLESADATPLESLTLKELNSLIASAEKSIHDLRYAYDRAACVFSDHMTHPAPSSAARDLVDLILLGSIDTMLSVTGVNDRLGASGAWWWQYRDGFWESLTRAAKEKPQLRFNAPELIRAVATRIKSQPLTTPQIERLVNRYVLEYARYEAAARNVEDRLRRMLIRERIKALIGSRAKDPESLRGKLERKREKYGFRELDVNLGSVVTDLAGVRVILYDEEQIGLVAQLISQIWTVISDETHDSEYRARHLTIRIKEAEQRSIDGAICEIQLSSLASHAFNELEHDIGYKDQDVAPAANVKGLLDVVHRATGTLGMAIRELLAARKDEIAERKSPITSAMGLGAVLDRIFDRRTSGDFEALLWLWRGVAGTLTRDLIERTAPALFESAGSIAPEGADDATKLALALALDAPHEVAEMAREYRDQDSALIRAIIDQAASS